MKDNYKLILVGHIAVVALFLFVRLFVPKAGAHYHHVPCPGLQVDYGKLEGCPVISPEVTPEVSPEPTIEATPSVAPTEKPSDVYGLPGDGQHTGGDGLSSCPSCTQAPLAPNTGFEPK